MCQVHLKALSTYLAVHLLYGMRISLISDYDCGNDETSRKHSWVKVFNLPFWTERILTINEILTKCLGPTSSSDSPWNQKSSRYSETEWASSLRMEALQA